MLPTTRTHTQLGISNDSRVVVYDNNEMFGMFSAARVWWVFHAMGHQMVSILDGGLPKWKEAGGMTEEGPFREPAVSEYLQRMYFTHKIERSC